MTRMTSHNVTTRPRITPDASLSPCGYVTGVNALSHRGYVTGVNALSHPTRHAAASQGKKAAALHFCEAGGWGGDLGWVAMLHMAPSYV